MVARADETERERNVAIGSKNKDKIIRSIRSQEDFTAASMSGTRIGARYPVQAGRLNASPEECKRLQLGIAAGRVTYVVYSYGTPIAWVEKDGNGYVPPINYSPITTNHQGIARLALES